LTYTRLTAQAALQALREQGYSADQLGLDHGVGHFRPLSITRQRHLLAYHGMQ